MNQDAPEVTVRMGQLALGRAPTILKATLGSCVGIALVWRERGLCALAHSLLPRAPAADLPGGARYVDQAIDSMLRLMQATPAHGARIEAHLAGGANMSRRAAAASRTPMVGRLNVEALLAELAARRIEVRSRDLGGDRARQVRLDCASGTLSVLAVAAPSRLTRARRRSTAGAPGARGRRDRW
ncbi:MAG: chemotaxis protein CheD [Burkholderiales bacterium]|nr:chemotaxis protein CheD [Burkholderiales bacterium]MDE1928901.1 chemotaxis protein CheD [Burkholderiales bacterium]MDE2159463.1 chemotaxis protein CheD [Burkholderiales bacterium]MDE2501521.1 chemotaxis protein CheD [Burkholderiales bacterium]